MASRKGTLLEKNVGQLLTLSGFNSELNKIYNGYEIDVFLKYKNLKIAFECKQYERSTLAVRNLIHQWDSKNKELNFDKIVHVLVGCDILDTDYQLAKKYNMLIWDEQKLTNLLDNAIEKKIENKNIILKELGINNTYAKEVDTTANLEETGQQNIIKEALGELLRRCSKDKYNISTGFTGFRTDSPYYVINYSFDENGFMLNFLDYGEYIGDYEKDLEKIRKLLLTLKFKEVNYKEETINTQETWLFTRTEKIIEPEEKLSDLDEKEFGIYHESRLWNEHLSKFDKDINVKSLYAQCGKDTAFVASLTDKIFKEVFKANENYKIKIDLGVDAWK
ncbi:MAG: hypothetical protein AABX75_02100 [Nanoarchaeota archaeon]